MCRIVLFLQVDPPSVVVSKTTDPLVPLWRAARIRPWHRRTKGLCLRRQSDAAWGRRRRRDALPRAAPVGAPEKVQPLAGLRFAQYPSLGGLTLRAEELGVGDHRQRMRGCRPRCATVRAGSSGGARAGFDLGQPSVLGIDEIDELARSEGAREEPTLAELHVLPPSTVRRTLSGFFPQFNSTSHPCNWSRKKTWPILGGAGWVGEAFHGGRDISLNDWPKSVVTKIFPGSQPR